MYKDCLNTKVPKRLKVIYKASIRIKEVYRYLHRRADIHKSSQACMPVLSLTDADAL